VSLPLFEKNIDQLNSLEYFKFSWVGSNTPVFRVFIPLSSKYLTLEFYSLNLELLLLLVGIIFTIQWVSFVPAYKLQSERFYDLVGSLTYVFVIVVALLLNESTDPRALIVSGLVVIWALRLGGFLFIRVLKTGKDVRFDKIKPNFRAFFMAWTLQGVWVTLTLSSVLVVVLAVEKTPLGPVSFLGLVLWCVGFLIEVAADAQKYRFRATDGNQDKFIQIGLWAKSRHPNYFGEILLWVGMAVIAAPVFSGWLWFGLLSPIFVYVLITRVSGIPLLEAAAERKWGEDSRFREYKENTPVLFPRIRLNYGFMFLLRGCLVFLYIAVNLLLASLMLTVLVVGKVVFTAVIPMVSVQVRIYNLMEKLFVFAVAVDDVLLWKVLKIKLEIHGDISVAKDETCLIIPNHNSWADIFIVQHLFCRKTPVIKFLVKQGLIYFPIVGWICWAYQFPFIPRGKKYETSEGRAIAHKRLSNDLSEMNKYPASIVNFVEGTRYSREKKRRQKAVFKHLLTPRVGGLHSIFKIFEDQISSIYDVTIVYDKPSLTFFDFISGRCMKIVVCVDQINNSSSLYPSEDVRIEKEQLRGWLLQLWHKKDQKIDDVINEKGIKSQRNC